jgi:hypothetical protein
MLPPEERDVDPRLEDPLLPDAEDREDAALREAGLRLEPEETLRLGLDDPRDPLVAREPWK